jgi:N utilization substance protein A
MRDAGSDPQVIVSRSEEVFMERLFELEVPEVYEGIVEIKKIARIPGDRAKVAVESHDERVDPVGACVGVKGVRIHAVVRELDNENIDVLLWDGDPHQLIVNALSPANPVSVVLNEETEPPRAKVDVPADEVSQAIGRRGVNIRLASKLTGFEIDVYRDIPENEEDIEIEEFGDALAPETIESLKTIGCDTGKAVLELSSGELARRAEGIDREKAERIVEIIETEFARGPSQTTPVFSGGFVLEAAGTTLEESEVSLPDEEEEEMDVEPAPADEMDLPAPPADAVASAEAPPSEDDSEDEPSAEDEPSSEEAAVPEEVNAESVSENAPVENAPAASSVAEDPAPEDGDAEDAEDDDTTEEEGAAPDGAPAPNVAPDPEDEEESAEKEAA